MKVKKCKALVYFMVIAMLVAMFPTVAGAASVTPKLFDSWKSGNAEFERDQAECTSLYAYKVDNAAYNDTYTFTAPDGRTNSITISNSDSYTFN